jgi:hypothetical protein
MTTLKDKTERLLLVLEWVKTARNAVFEAQDNSSIYFDEVVGVDADEDIDAALIKAEDALEIAEHVLRQALAEGPPSGGRRMPKLKTRGRFAP